MLLAGGLNGGKIHTISVSVGHLSAGGLPDVPLQEFINLPMWHAPSEEGVKRISVSVRVNSASDETMATVTIHQTLLKLK